jgi:hypothetical protein
MHLTSPIPHLIIYAQVSEVPEFLSALKSSDDINLEQAAKVFMLFFFSVVLHPHLNSGG